MKRSILLASVFVFGAAGAASAADLGVAPAIAPASAVVAAAPMFWTGPYVGGSLGWVGGTARTTDINGYNTAGERWGRNPSGFIGGLQLGYNYQVSPNFVVGLEGEIGYMDLKKTTIQPSSPNGDTRAWTNDGAFGAITGKLGFAADAFLLYGKGGVAFYGGSSRVVDSSTAAPGGNTINATADDTRVGWTLGAGVEYAFTRNWSAKVEYDHYDFGSKTFSAVAGNGATYSFRNNLTADAVRVGVNYRF